jgi:2-dehydro-3-deoxyphosphooctonate aldolase (KDO 8-P synthase)
MNVTRTITLGDWNLGGGHPFFLIAGPCVIESRQHCLEIASQLEEITNRLGIPLIFKASYDKANRTSIGSYRGPGLEGGLEVLQGVKSELGIPVTSDVHEVVQVTAAAEVLDVIQVPAFLCRQTDLICAAAETGRVVNVKKGQFLAPPDVENILKKAQSIGNSRLLITERGTSFGYNNLVVDFRSLPQLRSFGCPVVFDTTHSVQLPGAGGTKSSGQAEFIPYLSRAAVAVGVDGIFCEVHECPEKALSDGANALRLDRLEGMLKWLKSFDQLAKHGNISDVAEDCSQST